MNREALLEASAGITVGLLIVVVAAFRSSKMPSKGVLRRSAMLALITYAIVAVPVFTPNGMTVLGMIALLVVVGLALAGSLLARKYATDSMAPTQRFVQALVGTGIAAVLLIATGQTLALVSRVDPRVAVVVVGAVAGLLVAGQGLVASSRISSLTMWLLIVPILISLALGFLLGDVPVVISPIRLVDGAPYVAILATAVSIFVLGWADSSLDVSSRAARWSPIRVLVWVFVVIVLVLVGLLMFLGGAIFAPSMEFFVVPANIDALPGLAGVLLAILTVLFAALVANALTGVGALGLNASTDQPTAQAEPVDDADPEVPVRALAVAGRWVYVSAFVAVVVALVDPGSQRVLVATALVAAAVMGAQLSRGDGIVGSIAGVITGVVAVAVLALTGQFALGWGSIVATVVVLAASFIAGRVAGSKSESEATNSPVPVANQ
ncbi:MAG: hypothetical protein ACOYD0_12080 [Candidatus Nanopelagicales bacterium]